MGLAEQLIMWQLISAVINGAGFIIAAAAIGWMALRIHDLEGKIKRGLDR